MGLIGEYRTCEAVVERAGRSSLRVRLCGAQLNEHCGGCTACAAQGKKPAALTVAHTGKSPAVGTRVSVRHYRVNPALAAGAVFGLPVALMIAGAAAAPALSGAGVDSPASCLGAVAGLFAGALLAWVLERVLMLLVPARLTEQPS